MTKYRKNTLKCMCVCESAYVCVGVWICVSTILTMAPALPANPTGPGGPLIVNCGHTSANQNTTI